MHFSLAIVFIALLLSLTCFQEVTSRSIYLDQRDDKFSFQRRQTPPPTDASISATTIGKIPGDTINGATTSLLITVLGALKTTDPATPPPTDD